MKDNSLSEKETDVLRNVENWVKDKFEKVGALSAAHGWDHIKRVADSAIEICRAEGGNEFLVRLSALLHDVGRVPEAESAIYRGRTIKPRLGHAYLSVWEVKDKLKELRQIGVLNAEDLKEVQRAIARHSRYLPESKSKLLKILQDADRLDVYGIVGLVRCLEHAKQRGVPIETTELPPEFSDADYPNLRSWGDAKSLLSHLWYVYKYKDDMNTAMAKRKIEPRVRIYRDFIELLKNSIIKKEGLDYEFWLGFLEYAQKHNLERLNEEDLEKFKRLRKD